MGRAREAENSVIWTCPRCRRQFRSATKYHSCVHIELADHFSGKDSQVRDLFDNLLGSVQAFGPVQVYALRTRIVLQGEVQFATLTPRKHWLEGTLWLRWKAEHPLISCIEMHVFRDYVRIFRLTSPGDVDPEFIALLHEAYMLAELAPHT